MRQDENAELLIYCPKCGLWVNEYNWTLETASKYSVKGKKTPTVAYIMLDMLRGNFKKWENFKIHCPRCHESVFLKKMLPLPKEEEIEEYTKQVSQEYVDFLY
ncbi:MAG TPA: hypothetical protein VFC73_08225 [Syntrophomonadaceae bacterium]|nr:hypothetical protein [Syntrophomonadaceae bacterium]